MKKTIDIIKQKRTVPPGVKEGVKMFNKLKKEIFKVLKEKEMTILEIANEINADVDSITFNLMTCLKFGTIEVGKLDDNDEYYYYKLKNR